MSTKPTEFIRSTARTASSPPDYGQPELRFNPGVDEFVPSIQPQDHTAAPSHLMETVQEVSIPKDYTQAPEFVPAGFGSQFEPQELLHSEIADNPFSTRALNHNAEEFQFSGQFMTADIEAPPAVIIPEFKPVEEVKVVVPDPVEDVSTSDDEECCAENRPLRPEDESDQESDFEEQPATQPSIPHSPLRETSMQQHIYNPDFILAVRNEELSQRIPDAILHFLNREVKEIMEGKRGARYPKPPQQPMMRSDLVAQQAEPGWRPQPTEEEKKIKEEAKRTSDRLNAVKPEDEVTKRTIKITLNKLSPTNFDKLKEQLLEIAKQNDDNLRLMSQGIFDKAWSQVKFTQLYANLCQYLDDYYANLGPPDAPQAAGRPKGKVRKNKFREAILNMCQQVFEAEDDLDVTGLDDEQAEKKRNTHRDRTLGNVRFIGELYKVNILGQTTLLWCAWDLIDQRLSKQSVHTEDLELNEDRLEGVNILLTTVKDKLNVSARVQDTMNKMYEQLRQIVQKRADLSTKIKYRLLNLIEERDKQGDQGRSGKY